MPAGILAATTLELCSSHKTVPVRVHVGDGLLTDGNGIRLDGGPPVALGHERRAAGARLGRRTWGRH